eukprot:352985-Chlamydomonas_euryale.AAC.1
MACTKQSHSRICRWKCGASLKNVFGLGSESSAERPPRRVRPPHPGARCRRHTYARTSTCLKHTPNCARAKRSASILLRTRAGTGVGPAVAGRRSPASRSRRLRVELGCWGAAAACRWLGCWVAATACPACLACPACRWLGCWGAAAACPACPACCWWGWWGAAAACPACPVCPAAPAPALPHRHASGTFSALATGFAIASLPEWSFPSAGREKGGRGSIPSAGRGLQTEGGARGQFRLQRGKKGGVRAKRV